MYIIIYLVTHMYDKIITGTTNWSWGLLYTSW